MTAIVQVKYRFIDYQQQRVHRSILHSHVEASVEAAILL